MWTVGRTVRGAGWPKLRGFWRRPAFAEGAGRGGEADPAAGDEEGAGPPDFRRGGGLVQPKEIRGDGDRGPAGEQRGEDDAPVVGEGAVRAGVTGESRRGRRGREEGAKKARDGGGGLSGRFFPGGGRRRCG